MNLNLKLPVFLATCLFMATAPSFASDGSGTSVGGGGDSLVIEFMERAYRIVDQLKQFDRAECVKKINVQKLHSALENLSVEATDQVLYLEGVRKEAINYPAQQLIVLNRQDWREAQTIKDTVVQAARDVLVLHELLGVTQQMDPSYQVSLRAIREIQTGKGLNEKAPTPSVQGLPAACDPYLRNQIMILDDPTQASAQISDFYKLNTELNSTFPLVKAYPLVIFGNSPQALMALSRGCAQLGNMDSFLYKKIIWIPEPQSMPTDVIDSLGYGKGGIACFVGPISKRVYQCFNMQSDCKGGSRPNACAYEFRRAWYGVGSEE